MVTELMAGAEEGGILARWWVRDEESRDWC